MRDSGPGPPLSLDFLFLTVFQFKKNANCNDILWPRPPGPPLGQKIAKSVETVPGRAGRPIPRGPEQCSGPLEGASGGPEPRSGRCLTQFSEEQTQFSIVQIALSKPILHPAPDFSPAMQQPLPPPSDLGGPMPLLCNPGNHLIRFTAAARAPVKKSM